MVEVLCSRCGVTKGETTPPHLPEGWEGWTREPVCPNCQLAEWHPRCTSVRAESGYGQRVDLEALERGESTTLVVDDVPVVLRSTADLESFAREIAWCDHVDLSVSVTDGDDDWPTEWVCSECGGTTFQWVHADYQASGLKGTSFGASVEEPDDE